MSSNQKNKISQVQKCRFLLGRMQCKVSSHYIFHHCDIRVNKKAAFLVQRGNTTNQKWNKNLLFHLLKQEKIECLDISSIQRMLTLFSFKRWNNLSTTSSCVPDDPREILPFFFSQGTIASMHITFILFLFFFCAYFFVYRTRYYYRIDECSKSSYCNFIVNK